MHMRNNITTTETQSSSIYMVNIFLSIGISKDYTTHLHLIENSFSSSQVGPVASDWGVYMRHIYSDWVSILIIGGILESMYTQLQA